MSSSVIVSVLGFVAVIGPLIFLHEFGHYMAGRWFGVKADTFSIGMGRELFGWTDRRGTRWRVAALPIGGYVKFAGDMNPASTPTPEWLALPPGERARTFQAKPVWQRFLIVAAGPLTNFLVAIAIFTAFFAWNGVPRSTPVIERVQAGSPAAREGFRPGDRILAIGGGRIASFDQISAVVRLNPAHRLSYRLERDGRVMNGTIVPAIVQERDPHGGTTDIGLLGIGHGPATLERVGPVRAVGEAVSATANIVRMMGQVLGQILLGERSAKQLGGPLKVAQYSGDSMSDGWLGYINFLTLISINLGFMNLLPIPLLDGGHLLFYAIEGIRRRPLPARAQEWAFKSGLALVLGFMMFVTINDLGSFGLWRTLAGLIG